MVHVFSCYQEKEMGGKLEQITRSIVSKNPSHTRDFFVFGNRGMMEHDIPYAHKVPISEAENGKEEE